MKKSISLILVLSLLFCSAAFAEEGGSSPAGESAGRVLEKGALPLYLEANGAEPLREAFPVYYVDGVKDLPFADVRDVIGFVNDLLIMDNPDNPVFVIEYTEESEIAEMNLDGNESYLWMDFGNGNITYTNFSTFARLHGVMIMDMLASSGFDATTGEAELFMRIPNTLFQREGRQLTISLERDYSIPMIMQDGFFLMPLHTAFALLFDLPFGGNLITCISPTGIFIGGSQMFINEEEGILSDLGELYYSDAAGDRSATLAGYGLNEFCMEMDYFYGLKDAHNISKFFDLIVDSNLTNELLSTSTSEADMALAKLLNFYLDDGHTGYTGNSPGTGVYLLENDPLDLEYGFSAHASRAVKQAFKDAHGIYPDAEKPYLEIGNTAYLYQTGFDICRDPAEYYTGEITEEDIIGDTLALIIYAHRQITRENSPIENVVIDLSCNGGGIADAAIFMMCWFLGEAPFSTLSPATGAQSTSLYRADINLDRKFDENDVLTGKNLYCLTSPLSFSCGNLVPWVFKASGRVTLLGDTTGGGSCIVMPMSSAWGSLYQISGPVRISFVKNGSYYDVDRGIDPDVFLTKTTTFCDREKLTEMINNLY